MITERSAFACTRPVRLLFLWLGAIAAAIAAPAGSWPAAQAVRPVVVVIDSTSPLKNADLAARFRQAVLSSVGQSGRERYFELTDEHVRAIPEEAVRNVASTEFTFPAGASSGVTLTFAEANEILRGNQAVRDTIIRRECPGGSAGNGCGPAVHVAATTLLAKTETTSALKLQHLIATAAAERPERLILITAGWPYRDGRGVRVEEAVDTLRALGTKLLVLRLQAPFPYKGLVKDAAETLALRLVAPLLPLHNEADVSLARRVIGESDHPATASPPLVSRQSAVPATRHDTRPLCGGVPDVVLDRASRYVTRFEHAFSAAIWRERYEQELRAPRRFSASGARFQVVTSRRQLDSEMFFLWLAPDATWITVRDVVALDGQRRPEVDRRLQTLLSDSSISLARLRALAAENGRFNIGPIVRTFNEPTLALVFLDEHYRHRFAFRAGGERTPHNQRAVIYDFEECARPTVIQDGDRDVWARGRVWIRVETGEVLRTVLEVADRQAGLRGQVTVHYGPNPKFGVLVPLEMREEYTSDSGEHVVTRATYSDFRRFETRTRLIVRP